MPASGDRRTPEQRGPAQDRSQPAERTGEGASSAYARIRQQDEQAARQRPADDGASDSDATEGRSSR